MTSNVINLERQRATRRRPRLHFATAVEALTYANATVTETRTFAADQLLVDALDLDTRLAVVQDVLAELVRLHSEREGISR